MDWNNIKNNLVVKSKQALYKTKEFADQGMKATQEKIDDVIKLKNIEEFEELKIKRFVAIFGDKNNSDYKKLLLKLPIIKTKAWIDGAKLRTIEISEYTGLQSKFSITKIPTIIIFEENNIIERFEEMKDISNYFIKPVIGINI